MILALCGLPRVGKDEFAKKLKDHHNVEIYSFALPIKQMCCAAFGWELDDFENDDKDIIDSYWGISKRQAMEYIGSKIMRGSIREEFPLFNKMIGERIWVKRFEKFYLDNKHCDIIVTDLRYDPEYEFFNSIHQFKKIIQINRPNYRCDQSKWYDIKNFKIDIQIDNDIENDLWNYHSKVIELYDLLLKEKQQWK